MNFQCQGGAKIITLCRWSMLDSIHPFIEKLLDRLQIEITLRPKYLEFKLTNFQRCSLLQALSGHFACNYFLKKIQRAQTDLCPQCKVVETVDHVIFHCAAYSAQRNAEFRESKLCPPFKYDKILSDENQTQAISRILTLHRQTRKAQTQ